MRGPYHFDHENGQVYTYVGVTQYLTKSGKRCRMRQWSSICAHPGCGREYHVTSPGSKLTSKDALYYGVKGPAGNSFKRRMCDDHQPKRGGALPPAIVTPGIKKRMYPTEHPYVVHIPHGTVWAHIGRRCTRGGTDPNFVDVWETECVGSMLMDPTVGFMRGDDHPKCRAKIRVEIQTNGTATSPVTAIVRHGSRFRGDAAFRRHYCPKCWPLHKDDEHDEYPPFPPQEQYLEHWPVPQVLELVSAIEAGASREMLPSLIEPRLPFTNEEWIFIGLLYLSMGKFDLYDPAVFRPTPKPPRAPKEVVVVDPLPDLLLDDMIDPDTGWELC